MALVAISIKFPTEQREFLQRKACEVGHGRISRIVKELVNKDMAAEAKRAKRQPKTN